MKQFNSELNGTTLFKKIIAFLLAYIVCLASAAFMITNEIYGGYFVSLLLAVVSGLFMTFHIYSQLINSVSLDEEKFSFVGSFGDFIAVFVKGILLTSITAGIYGPWFERNIIAFFAENTEFPNKGISFNSTGGKLLKYIFFALLLPCIGVGIIFGLLLVAGESSTGIMVVAIIVYLVGVSIVCGLYYSYVVKWYLNFSFGTQDLVVDLNLGKTILVFTKEILLSIITIGIYIGAAYTNIFRYIANNSYLQDRETSKIETVSFKGSTLDGFKIVLGQSILSVITLGIYLPWAYARIYNWFISNVEIDDNVAQIAQ